MFCFIYGIVYLLKENVIWDARKIFNNDQIFSDIPNQNFHQEPVKWFKIMGLILPFWLNTKKYIKPLYADRLFLYPPENIRKPQVFW